MTMVVTPPWFLSRHAMKRMDEMDLTRPEVLAVIDDPEITWTSNVHDHGADVMVAVRGKLEVAYNPVLRVVITVLWRGDFARC